MGNGVLPPNKAVDLLPIAFAFGVGILVQAYSFGHVSGGHFNPGKKKPCVVVPLVLATNHSPTDKGLVGRMREWELKECPSTHTFCYYSANFLSQPSRFAFSCWANVKPSKWSDT